MDAITRITKPAHLIDMADIIREGHPTLRKKAETVTFPLSNEEIILGEKMMQFLQQSQDLVMAQKMGLRAGVGLAAPQLNISKRVIAVLIPNPHDEDGSPPTEAFALKEVMYNPEIISHSVQEAAIAEGEGCLSVDREVPGLVIRHARVTIRYNDKNGNDHTLRLKDFEAMVVQHEIDHTNGIMFYDRINPDNPLLPKEGLILL